MKRTAYRISQLMLLSLLIITACQTQPATPPTPTPISTAQPRSLIGRPIKDNEHPAVYMLFPDGHTRLIDTLPVFYALLFQFQDLITVPAQQLRAYPLAMPLTRWLTGTNDPTLYLLDHGQRYKADARLLASAGGNPFEVSLVPDDFLSSYPHSPAATLPETDGITRFADQLATPTTQAALWSNDQLWIARSDGLIAWTPDSGQITRYDQVTNIDSLAAVNQIIYAATADHKLWSFDGKAWANSAIPGRIRTMNALNGDVWYADVNYYDTTAMRYHPGRGLIQRDQAGHEQVYTLDASENDPLKNITALAVQGNSLWIGTRFSGLLKFDPAQQSWQSYNTANSQIPDNAIRDLKAAPDGTLWLATNSGISHMIDNRFELYHLPDDQTERQPLRLILSPDSRLWALGENFIAKLNADKTWTINSPFSNPAFLDHWQNGVIDNHNHLWFLGDENHLSWDGTTWTIYDTQTHTPSPLVAKEPQAFDLPSPQTDYTKWLQAWPRPAQDNGYCIHYLASPTGERLELYQQIARLTDLKMRWLLVNYTNRAQLFTMAPAFAKAGITVIWRPFVRPYKEYPYWADDVKFLRSLGLPPYMQIYNEPSLGQEWEDAGKTVDQDLYLQHLLPAMQQVYEAGGFVGLQELDPDWLKLVLNKMKAQALTAIWQRIFFIPHSYGYNHPPDYHQDDSSVLNFLDFAKVFQAETGFVPMMIAGEGGWRPFEQQDPRYPMVTQTLHRDYLLSVFNWFGTGKLSNGDPLPDYLFAFCPWILSDPNDSAAWFDSMSGNRGLVIQGVEALPVTTRRFSWEH